MKKTDSPWPGWSWRNPKTNLSKFVHVSLELTPDQSTSLGSLGLGGQGWHKTALAVATLTAIYILQVTSWGHLGLGDSSGAIAGMLDLQALGSVPTFTLTNDGLSVSSSVQRGYNLLTMTEFMKTLEKCKLKTNKPEVLVVPDLLVQYSRYTDGETGHRKDVTSDDTVGCRQTCWESCSVVSYEGMCNCPMSSASA